MKQIMRRFTRRILRHSYNGSRVYTRDSIIARASAPLTCDAS